MIINSIIACRGLAQQAFNGAKKATISATKNLIPPERTLITNEGIGLKPNSSPWKNMEKLIEAARPLQAKYTEVPKTLSGTSIVSEDFIESHNKMEETIKEANNLIQIIQERLGMTKNDANSSENIQT